MKTLLLSLITIAGFYLGSQFSAFAPVLLGWILTLGSMVLLVEVNHKGMR